MIRLLALALLLTACDPSPAPPPPPSSTAVRAEIARAYVDAGERFTTRFHQGVSPQEHQSALAADQRAYHAVLGVEQAYATSNEAAFALAVPEAREAIDAYSRVGQSGEPLR